MDLLSKRRPAEALVPISALTGDGLDILTAELVKRLPNGPALFPEETLTDQPERVIAAEFVREKVFRLTGQEVPYGVAVEVTDFTERPTGGLYIRAVIHVERESHKGILIGAKGAKLKAIGQAARADLEALLGAKVFLELFVRVEPEWTKKEHLIRRMGYGQ
jgi:GTP-binding protein Era